MGRGYLGLGMRPVHIPEDLVTTLQLSADVGLMVANLDPDGPGSRSGVVFGDVIVALEGKPVGSIRELQGFLEPESVGKTLSMSIIRGVKLIGLKLVVGEQRQQTTLRRRIGEVLTASNRSEFQKRPARPRVAVGR